MKRFQDNSVSMTPEQQRIAGLCFKELVYGRPNGGLTMCVPEITIRPDGRGFVIRKGGIDFDAGEAEDGSWYAFDVKTALYWGGGSGTKSTIMEAVDNALAKVRAASPQGDGQE